MDYDLERLGSREFEHLCQALALKLLGPAVRVYGDGPDGGREFVLEGTTAAIRDSEGLPWEGKVVGQAKFHLRPGDVSANSKWLNTQLALELERWATKREKKDRPEYLIFATNVVLSPAQGGGLDSAGAVISGYAMKLGLKDWQIWHYDQICRLLDDAIDIRRAFAGPITPGDALTALVDYFDEATSEAGRILVDHAAKDLIRRARACPCSHRVSILSNSAMVGMATPLSIEHPLDVLLLAVKRLAGDLVELVLGY